MGAVAARTTRLRMASSVHIAPYRHPLSSAHQFATVDVLSGGRLIVGVGSGWDPEEFAAVGADFFEIWSTPETVPTLASLPDGEPTARPFTIMPPSGHLMRIIDIYPPSMGGHRTVMHRTRTLDYALVIEGEIVLVLSDSEVVLGPGEVVVQRGTDHAWENRTSKVTRMAFFHLAGEFSDELLAKLVAEITEDSAAGMQVIARRDDLDAAEKVRAITRENVRRQAEHATRFQLLIRSEADLPEGIAAKHEAGRRAVLRSLAGVIESGIAEGAFRPVDARVAALGLLGMNNWVAWWYQAGGRNNLDIICDRLRREFKVESNVGKPEVAYREAIGKKVACEYKYAKQSGGRGQFGHVLMEIWPGERGTARPARPNDWSDGDGSDTRGAGR